MKKFAELLVNYRYVIFTIVIVVAVICASLISKVNVNSDMITYLPDKSPMKKGTKIIAKEFPNMETEHTIRVMFKGLNNDEKKSTKKVLEKIDNVSSISYELNKKEYNKDDYTLYIVKTKCDGESKETLKIVDTINEKYANRDITVISGETQMGLPVSIMIMAVVIMMIFLTLMCNSWIEPVLFLFTIGVAVLLNMGTNIFKEYVSQTSFSISAILQLALSMDYSIILSDRYRQERMRTDNKIKAMIKAIKNAFSSFTSSAFTTFVGLLMMVFMNFKLGADLGIVLAKGVLCSWFCIMTILPTVLIVCDKVIFATSKKSLHVNMDSVAKIGYKVRKVMPICFLALFCLVYYIQTQTKITFSVVQEDEISKIFPSVNTIVAVYNNNDEDKVQALADKIEDDKLVSSVMSYPTTIGKKQTSKELSDYVSDMVGEDNDIDISADMLNIMYYSYYNEGKLPSISVSDFINFIADDVIESKTFSEYLDDDMVEQVDSMKKFADAKTLKKKMSIDELADFFDMDVDDLKALFVLYYSKVGGVDTGRMKLATFVDFVVNDVMEDNTYKDMFSSSIKEQLDTLSLYVDKDKMTKKMSYSEASKILGIESDTVKLLYVYYYAKQSSYQPQKMTFVTFIDFMINKVATNKMFASYFNDDAMAQIKQMDAFTNKSAILTKLDSSQMSKQLGIDASMVELIYSFYYGEEKAPTTKVTISEFINFMSNVIMKNDMLSSSLDTNMKESISTMGQMIEIAKSQKKLTAIELASIIGMEEAGITQLLMAVSGGDTSKMSMTLAEFTNMLVNVIMPNSAYEEIFDDATKTKLTLLNQLIQGALANVELTASDISTMFGINNEQVAQLMVLYVGINTKDKKMSMIDMVNYILEMNNQGGALKSAIDRNTVEKLKQLQGIMNLVISNTKLSYKDLAKTFDLDNDTMKLLFTLYSSYQDTSEWKLSLQTLVNFMVDNNKTFGSMMNKDMLSKLKLAKSIINGAVAGTNYSAKELASLIGMDNKQLTQLYLLYISKKGDVSHWGTSITKLVDFLVADVLKNKEYSSMFDKDTSNMLRGAKTIIDAVIDGKKYKAKELTNMLSKITNELQLNMVELLYLYYGSMKESDASWTMSIDMLFNYLVDEIIEDEKFDAMLDDDFKDNIKDMQTQLSDAISQMVGENHSLMVMNTYYPDEANSTYKFIGNMEKEFKAMFDGKVYMVANSVMNYEMNDSFKQEMWLMTILTVVAIFVIVAITFKSLAVPTILVLIVQCGVYITISASYVRGEAINYLASLMVQAILMGATVDYGILFTNYYREYRAKLPILDTLKKAYKGSLHTIFTSGMVLMMVTGIIGLFSGNATVGPICLSLAIGTMSAVLLILFVLPGMLAVSDRFVTSKKHRFVEK